MEIGYRLGAYERFACITRNFLIRTSTDTTRVSTRASPTQKQSTVVLKTFSTVYLIVSRTYGRKQDSGADCSPSEDEMSADDLPGPQTI